MDPILEKKIDTLTKLTEENHDMLKKVRRVQKWSRASQIVKYVFIIGISLGAFYFLKPYYQAGIDFYTKGANSINSVQNFFGSKE